MGNENSGRLTKFDEKVALKIIDLVRGGNYIDVAAAASGVGRSTLYEWLRKSAEGDESFNGFSGRVHEAASEAEARAVLNVQKAAQAGDWKASAWYLERKHWQRWSKRDFLTADVNSNHTETLEVKIEAQLQEDAESADLLKQLFRRQVGLGDASSTAEETI